MHARHGIARMAFAIAVVATSACAGQEQHARRRFQIEPAVDRFLKTVAGEVGGWLEGYAGRPSKHLYQFPPHLLFRDRIRPDLVDGQLAIEWRTAPVPAGFRGRSATFAWAGGISPRHGVKSFDLLVDGVKRFAVRTVPDEQWALTGADGSRLLFNTVHTDDGGRRFGYMRLVAPVGWLTAGRALRLRFVGTEKEFKAWPRVYRINDSVRWLRTTPRPGLFSYPHHDADAGGPVRYRFIARPQWAEKPLEIELDGKILAETELAAADGLSVASAEVESASPERFSKPFNILVDGDVAGTTPALPLAALARWRKAAEQIRRGPLRPDQRREAAMVLARGHLLAQFLSAEEPRMDAVRRRARSLAEAEAALARALADFAAPGDAYQHRRGDFHTAYISGADGSGQIYSLHVPPGYDPADSYALEVVLHGAGGTYDTMDLAPGRLDYLVARVDGRGVTGYGGLGELAVLEVIRDVQAHYSIDPDRVRLSGASMGGYGTWRLASRYPDLFAAAAPTCGGAGDAWLENLANVPIWNFHDDADWSVPVDGSRLAVGFLGRLGYPVIHTESSGRGHTGRTREAEVATARWMRRQQRDPCPRFVRYTTTSPVRGRAYWLQILEFTDPNRAATVRVRAREGTPTHQLFVHLTNIDVLAAELPEKLFERGRDVAVSVDGPPLTVKAPLPRRVFIHRVKPPGARGAYAVSLKDPRGPRPYRPYVAGGMNSLYTTGEPLLIVKGTGGKDEKLRAAIDRFCRTLSFHSTGWARMPQGRVPIKADVDVTAEDIGRCNLILVGPASANRLLARITARLPAVEKAGALTIGPERYGLAGKSYGLFYYNPESPRRLIVVMSCPEAGKFYEDVGNGVTGRIADDRPFGLVVNEVDPPCIVRRIAWNKQWQPAEGAFEMERLGGVFATRGKAAEFGAAALRTATGADFALYRAPEKPDAPRWAVAFARWHDLKADAGGSQAVCVSVFTGAELAAVLKVLKEKGSPLVTRPAVRIDRLDAERRYRVCLSVWDAGSLARTAQRNLPNVERVRVDLYRQMRRAAELSGDSLP